jgi:hypothetical protein
VTDWRAESLVDELLPEDLDWQTWVRRYPKTALSLAAVVGYLLGRSRGDEIVASVTTRAADSLTENLNQLIESRG